MIARYAVILDGLVTNVTKADETWVPEKGIAVQSDDAQIGWAYANGVFTPTPEPERPAGPPRRVRKGLIVDRIQATGKLSDVFTVLGGPGSYLYEKWQAAPPNVLAEDDEVIQVLEAAGLDPAVILAPE